MAHKPQASVSLMSPPHFDVFCDLLERLSIAFTANVNLYHLSKFSIHLSYTVHCNYTKIGKLTQLTTWNTFVLYTKGTNVVAID